MTAVRPRTLAVVPQTLEQRVMNRLRDRGLFSEAERIAAVCGVRLEDVCGLDKNKAVVVCRSVIVRWLAFDYGKGRNEIADIFERDQSGLAYHLTVKGVRGKFVVKFEAKLGMKR